MGESVQGAGDAALNAGDAPMEGEHTLVHCAATIPQAKHL
jgi:hypothetical protein